MANDYLEDIQNQTTGLDVSKSQFVSSHGRAQPLQISQPSNSNQWQFLTLEAAPRCLPIGQVINGEEALIVAHQ